MEVLKEKTNKFDNRHMKYFYKLKMSFNKTEKIL